jgi:hypothetical protein
MVERFYAAPAGSRWLAMDDLDMASGFGGAVALTAGYARNPLRVYGAPGTAPLAVVSDEAFADFGVSGSYGPFRLYLNFPTPLVRTGSSGTVGPYAFVAPSVNLAQTPDTLLDPRAGFDVRLFGEHGSPLRAGLSAQLFIPAGAREDYVTDGSVRTMFRALVAGDRGRLGYALELGAHVRGLNESPIPDSPRGSELLFGAGLGWRLLTGARTFTLGAEVFGETAFASLFAQSTTGVEGLVSGQLEEAGSGPGPHLRFKLGVGGGLDPRFGVPQWRIVLSVEGVFGKLMKGVHTLE